MNGIPQDYLKLLPRFTGKYDIIAQKHIQVFYAFVENLNLENFDVVLRLLVQSLDGETRKWFNTLPNNLINTWEELELDFEFTLKERKSRTLDRIQIDALEVKENFASTCKWKGKGEHGRRRGKEEANSSDQIRDAQEQKLDEMNKLIRNLSNKLVKLDLENKDPPRQIQ